MLGSEYEEILGQIDGDLGEMKDWRGCKGSKPKYLGYPCSLWVTFHALTVQAARQNTTAPFDVLAAIHGYVKHFFGCRYCSVHFQKMYSRGAEASVVDTYDGVLWLWKAHNEVNLRLKGELSEDPYFRKKVFPTHERCPECRDGMNFRSQDVVEYLEKVYGADAIVSSDSLGSKTAYMSGVGAEALVILLLLFII